jgi:sec-independent protein translocase protein TatC
MALDQVNVDDWDDVEAPSSGDSEMSFFDHIEALRWHIMRSLIVLFVAFVVVFLFKDFVFGTIVFGPVRPDFITYKILCGFSEAMCFDPPKIDLTGGSFINTGPSDAFITHMSISFWISLAITFPYMIWEIWRFISPGLFPTEQKAAGNIVIIGGFLFLFGVLFGYFVVSPLALTFLTNYEIHSLVKNAFRISDYIDLLVMMTIPLGFVFELPMVMYFLTKLGVISPMFLREYRRYAVVILMIVAAIVTPSPDAASMLLVFAPLYALYEISILVSQREYKKQLAKAE